MHPKGDGNPHLWDEVIGSDRSSISYGGKQLKSSLLVSDTVLLDAASASTVDNCILRMNTPPGEVLSFYIYCKLLYKSRSFGSIELTKISFPIPPGSQISELL